MASRIIHLAVTNELLKSIQVKDLNRLKFGVLLPDTGEKESSHFKYTFEEGKRKTYGLSEFRQKYGSIILKDDLYLGYYLHLVQDVVFRDFIYNWYHIDMNIKERAEILHRDYRSLNRYTVKKYNISSEICIPEDFESEEICNHCNFDIKWLSAALTEDCECKYNENPEYLTYNRADEYISYATQISKRELDALHGIGEFTDERALSWTKNKK